MDLIFYNLGRAVTPAVIFCIGFVILRAGLRRSGKQLDTFVVNVFVGATLVMTLVETFVFRPATGLLIIAALLMAVVGIVLIVASSIRNSQVENQSDVEAGTSKPNE